MTNLQDLDNYWQYLPRLVHQQIDYMPFSNMSAPFHKHGKTYISRGNSSIILNDSLYITGNIKNFKLILKDNIWLSCFNRVLLVEHYAN